MKSVKIELAKDILTRVRQNFAFDLSCEGFHSYWLPIQQPDFIGYKGDYLYIQIELFKKYKDEIFKAFFGSGSVYWIGNKKVEEYVFENKSLIEEDFYSDSFYVSQNIKRVIYFFHEGTVTFAGEHFLPKVKKILEKDKHLFNRAWWHDLPCNQK